MKLGIAIVAVLVAACQGSGESATQDDHADGGGIEVAKHRNCKPKIPYLNKLKHKEVCSGDIFKRHKTSRLALTFERRTQSSG